MLALSLEAYHYDIYCCCGSSTTVQSVVYCKAHSSNYDFLRRMNFSAQKSLPNLLLIIFFKKHVLQDTCQRKTEI